MIFARLSAWKFKSGKREKALKKIESIGPAGSLKGFRGMLELISTQDPDSAVLITLWDGEDALKSSAKGVFQDAAKLLEEFVAAPPDVKSYKVSSAEFYALTFGS